MFAAAARYWDDLTREFGAGWNRFWFRPSDPLALCWLRLLTGLVAMFTVASYTPALLRLFGPDGMLPIELVDQLRGEQWTSFSYFNYLHTAAELHTAHYVGLGVLALFTVGLFSRVTSILALVVVLSYIHRAAILTSQAEPILSMLLLYICLGPSGAYLSVDRWLKRRRAKTALPAAAEAMLHVPQSSAATIAVRLIQVHVCVVYFMMGLGKLSSPNQVWWEGEGVWWLIARPGTRLVDLTSLLADHPYVVNFWSHAIVAFEIVFPVLIWNRLARPLLLALAVMIWISLAAVSGLHTFCALMLIANLAFVPAQSLHACCGRRS